MCKSECPLAIFCDLFKKMEPARRVYMFDQGWLDLLLMLNEFGTENYQPGEITCWIANEPECFFHTQYPNHDFVSAASVNVNNHSHIATK
jgi:hypothetical protein